MKRRVKLATFVGLMAATVAGCTTEPAASDQVAVFEAPLVVDEYPLIIDRTRTVVRPGEVVVMEPHASFGYGKAKPGPAPGANRGGQSRPPHSSPGLPPRVPPQATIPNTQTHFGPAKR